MNEIVVRDADLRQAALKDMDAFLKVFVDAILKSVGGELNADTMPMLNASQITLLAYDVLQREVMDGGFVQLIYNGYGGFIFMNPFAKMVREWGLRDLAKLLFATRKLYMKYKDEIEHECDDDEFMAMFERYTEFDDSDDEFVEHEEEWTEAMAMYVDNHIDDFAKVVD